MLQYLPELLTIATIHLLGVMSPGPDFALISRNSLVYSRRTGILTALGLALGIMTHLTYTIVGIGVLIAQSIVLFTIIKFLGAGYLIYIGYQSLRSKKKIADASIVTETQTTDLSPLAAIRTGFLTNILNPKVTLFFLSVFSQVISPTTPAGVKVVYGLEMSVATFAWFSLVAIVLARPIIKTKFRAIQHYLERGFGVLLIALGIKVAVSR